MAFFSQATKNAGIYTDFQSVGIDKTPKMWYTDLVSRRDGIGRRVGLKIQW